MTHPKFEVYEVKKDEGTPEWRWRLVAVNGEIVSQGEAHGSRRDAIRAALRVADIASEADVVTVA